MPHPRKARVRDDGRCNKFGWLVLLNVQKRWQSHRTPKSEMAT